MGTIAITTATAAGTAISSRAITRANRSLSTVDDTSQRGAIRVGRALGNSARLPYEYRRRYRAATASIRYDARKIYQIDATPTSCSDLPSDSEGWRGGEPRNFSGALYFARFSPRS